MPKWQEFRGGSVDTRWTAANEWLATAKVEDDELKLSGFFMFTPITLSIPRLIVEFDSDIVCPEIVDL